MIEFIGCGALNLDTFFEVEDLSNLNFEGIALLPGREISLSSSEFSAFYFFLKKKTTPVACLPGGSSANTIFALSKWGFKTAFVGAVGKDKAGEKILNFLYSSGVNTSFIFKGGTTSQALIVIDKKRDRFIAVSPGTAENLLQPSLLNKLPVKTALFHFSSFASSSGFEFQKSIVEKFFFIYFDT